ncbi:MAG: deoxyribose-phosphate aldolase [Fusobacteriota bacterium]
MELNKYIDHTILKAVTTEKDIKKICSEAKEYDFFSVCVNSCYANLVSKELKESNVKTCSVVGFPLGAMTMEAKIFEAKDAVINGADEIDMVINIGKLKSGDTEYVKKEIAEIKKAIGKKTLKVILETCYLTDEEKTLVSKLSVEAKADFVKTSTGFGTGGATFKDVKLMKAAVNGKAKIKASGGIRDFETAKKYIDLGVSRIGASSGIKIINGEKVAEGEY